MYLERCRQRDHQLTPVAHHIHRRLAGLAAQSTGPSWQHGSMTAAYLVDRERVEIVRRSSLALAESCQDIQLALTGPWPPYSFVGVD
jgi:hypothetical protein